VSFSGQRAKVGVFDKIKQAKPFTASPATKKEILVCRNYRSVQLDNVVSHKRNKSTRAF